MSCGLASCGEPANNANSASDEVKSSSDADRTLQSSDSQSASQASDTATTSSTVVVDQVKQDSKTSMSEDLFKIQDTDIVLGDKDAEVLIIEYFAPTCVHCAYYHKHTFPEFKAKYIDTNKVAYVIREFVSNKQDLDASILARCNTNNDEFLKLVTVLLAQQDSWPWTTKYRELLANLGQLGGISKSSYDACLADEKLKTLLVSNSRSIHSCPSFVGTPSFFINGTYFKGSHTFDELSKYVDNALKLSKDHLCKNKSSVLLPEY